MLLSNAFLSILALGSLAEAQGIKFDKILKKKPGLSTAHNTKPTAVHTSQIATSIVRHLESIKPKTTTTKKSTTPTAKAGTAGAAAAPKIKVLPCATTTPMYSYVPTDNSPTGFLVDNNMAGISKNATTYPAGYSTSFTNAYGSLFASNYLDAFDLTSYNASACAAYCNANSQCTAFNIYFERQPSVFPADQCSNPSAITGVRCALWGSAISASQAQNVGQWRVNFMVVIQGSNGYTKNPAAATLSGYQAPVALAGAIDTRPLVATGQTDPFISSDFSTGTYNVSRCAALCSSAMACNYFNAVVLSLNGVSQGTYCQLYTRDVSAYAGLYTATNAGVTYDLLGSYGYVAVPTTTTTTSSSAAATTASAIKVTAAAVTFTTITTAWTGQSTVTSTIMQGTTGTILVQTPGKVSSTAAAVYTTTSVNSGTALTISTTTLAPATAGGPSIVRIAYPTPIQTCGNSGIRYAAYQNVWAGPNDSSANYTTYDPTSFKTIQPMYNGTTTFIAETNSGWVSWIKVYDQYVMANNLTLDHTFYVFANQDGYYSFNMPQGDNIVLLWLGAKAVTGWTRANADLIQYYTSSPTKVPQTVTVALKMGQYLPVRLHWGNRQGDGEVDLNVYAPDGTLVMNSNLGQGTGQSSQNVIQFPCDSSIGPRFPAWGAET